jgi:long-chain acyl-CoA synthetase
LSWDDYRRDADGAAAGLIELGVQPGDRVAILSENRYEWLVADHAILSTGAINVPLHAPLAPPQVAYQVGHSEARGIIVSGQAQADKVREVLAELPRLEFLISFDSVATGARDHSPLTPDPSPPAGARGDFEFDRLRLLTWGGLKHRGWQRGSDGLNEIRRREAAVTPDDLATIIYTSGTTGNPKGVMLTHGNLLSNAEATVKVSDLHPGDIELSWLPYSHIYSRTVDHYATTLSGTVLALAESIDTLITNLAEVQPTWMTAVPRFYEKVWSSVESLSPAERSTELKRIFGPRLRQLSSGGAPLPRHVATSFEAAGVPLLEGYGLTESSPVISFNRLDCYRLGSVGQAVPGVEVRIAADGEILTRGPHVMRGYWKNPEATAAAIRDGWLLTGDLGHVDADGFLHITGRKKDLIITSLGKNISPSELERLLVSDPLIDQAVVYGDRRPYVTALVVPNLANLQSAASNLCVNLQVVDGYIRSPAVLDLLQRRVDSVMQAVSQPERVRKILVRARPFQLADDEVTATLKVRRHHIISKCEVELSALYD